MLVDHNYRRYGDAAYFAGRFRGQFHGSHVSDNEILHSVLLIHRLADEPYFRVRDVRAIYARDEDESMVDFTNRGRSLIFDAFDVADFFAATGTDFGCLFLRNGPDIHIGDYEWNRKNTRIHAFTADKDRKEIRYVLCQKPEDIDFSLGILHAVSDLMKLPHAAE